MSSLRANLFFVALGLSLLGLVMVYSATIGITVRIFSWCGPCTWRRGSPSSPQ
jgi:cell division protein FtsW (lipid II flippase)